MKQIFIIPRSDIWSHSTYHHVVLGTQDSVMTGRCSVPVQNRVFELKLFLVFCVNIVLPEIFCFHLMHNLFCSLLSCKWISPVSALLHSRLTAVGAKTQSECLGQLRLNNIFSMYCVFLQLIWHVILVCWWRCSRVGSGCAERRYVAQGQCRDHNIRQNVCGLAQKGTFEIFCFQK